jgi:SPP1 family predicted phage head-tail adaptor
MRAGQLNRLIALQKKVEAKNSSGDLVKAWVDLATPWARKIDLTGRELEAAMSIHAEISVKFLVRFREDVKQGMRIVLAGEAYHVISALDKRGDRVELQIYCSKGLIDGADGN